jgi:hypothetical protein
MPLPKTKDVGKLIDFLKKDKPNMSAAQRRAIALEEARKNGAAIKPAPKKTKAKSKIKKRKR